jgi:transposase
MNPTPTLGLDLAQRMFVAALRFDTQRVLKREFDNTPAGFRKLRCWLKQHFVGKVRAAMESTSTYGDALAHFLFAEGHAVYILNPEHVVCFARSRGQRNKTDPADAVTIAAFIAGREATPWQPPSLEQQKLRSLTRTRLQLVDHGKQLRLQLRTADEHAREHLQVPLTSILQQIAQIERDIKVHLKAFPYLDEQVRRAMTCKGIGFVTAATVIAELPPITPQTDPRTIAAWAGLTPRRWQSGSSQWRTFLSRKGNAYLRQALYMPALVAKRHNPLLRSFAQRLAANGKTATSILGAISHKLLRILVGMLKSNRDFDPNWSLQKG